MDTESQDSERYWRAKARVGALKAFYGHLGAFVVIISGLFVIDLATSDS